MSTTKQTKGAEKGTRAATETTGAQPTGTPEEITAQNEEALAWAINRRKQQPDRLFDPRFQLDVFYTQPDSEGYVGHRCSITERDFRLPLGAPTLQLHYGCQFNGCGAIEEDFDPYTIHPDIAVKGEAGVREALQKRVDALRDKAAKLLVEAHEAKQLLGMTFRLAWPAYWEVGKGQSLQHVK